jgi:hypothetical protein
MLYGPGGKTTYHGANQGGLGNCWYVAAASSIGEFPDVVKGIFRGIDSYPKNGQFVLNFYLYGKKHRMMIDDRLPGSGSGRSFRTKYQR